MIETWDALKKELKDQFLPCNSSWLARDALKKLQQTGSVRDYVREFSSIMLDIRNMSEEDKLHTFLTGLHNWARIELVHQGVQDFTSARAATDRLLDLRGDQAATESNRWVTRSMTKKEREKQ